MDFDRGKSMGTGDTDDFTGGNLMSSQACQFPGGVTGREAFSTSRGFWQVVLRDIEGVRLYVPRTRG